MTYLLAMAAMAVDHAPRVWFGAPDALASLVGRLAMPIFAVFAGRGAVVTADARRYLVRLLVLAAVSQPIYQLVMPGAGLNVLVTLAAGVCAWRWLWTAPAMVVGAAVLPMDYGVAGVVAVWASAELLQALRSGRPWGYASVLLGVAVVALNPLIVAPVGLFGAALAVSVAVGVVQDRTRLPRPITYGFYPIHLALLGFPPALL